jgi:hypothetical protein
LGIAPDQTRAKEQVSTGSPINLRIHPAAVPQQRPTHDGDDSATSCWPGGFHALIP